MPNDIGDVPVTWLNSKRRFLVRHGEHIALGLLVAMVSLIHIAWIIQDTRPQPGTDASAYLIKTFEFVDRLKEREGALLWQSVAGLSIAGGRPPLYQLLSVPFICAFGRSEDGAVSVNVIFEAILLLSTYGIGRLASGGKTGLLAAFLVATYPPIVDTSRIYLPHVATPACVALSLWLLLLLLGTRSVKVAWLFGASLAFGMLIQLQFLYLFPALVVFGTYMLLFQTAPQRPPNLKGVPHWLSAKLCDPFVLRGLLPGALIAAGLTAAWYLPHSQAILALRQGVTEIYGDVTVGFPDVPRSFWWYALTAPGAISTVLAVLLAAGLVVGTIKRRPGDYVLVIVFLTMYSAFSLSRQVMGWMYFASVLPVAAALTAVGVIDICKVHSAMQARLGRLLPAGVVLVCAGVAAFNFSVVTWGVQPWNRRMAIRLGAPLNSRTCLKRMPVAFCPNPARAEDWRAGDILQVILDDPECQGRTCHLVVVPLQDSFNSLIFDYYLARDFPDSRERVSVSSAIGWRGEPGTGEWIASDYLVYIPQLTGGAGIRTALTRFLASPPPVFADVHREVASFALPGGWTARLIKRTGPLTVDLTMQICEEALEAVSSDVMLYEKLGYLNLRAGNWARAEELFRQAIQVNPNLGWPYRALGYLYQRQRLADQAIAAFWKAIDQEPFEPKAYRHLADLFEVRGDAEEAIQVYRLAARNNPRLVWPYLELGALYVRENRQPEAVAAYQDAVRIEPWNQTAQANLQDIHWSLASSLSTARVYANHTPLIWWQGEAWVKPHPYAPDVLVGRSVLSVEGLTRPDQVHVHPLGADQATHLCFDIKNCQYETLQIGYGLADQVAGLSNGVRYTVQSSVDGGDSYTVLWAETITDSVWLSQTLPLVAFWGEDVTFQLIVDALGDDGCDWLQTTVRLFPAQEVWNLAANLSTVRAATADAPLSWNGSSAWIDGDGRSLVTLSKAPVQGAARDNQVQFHPYGDRQDTTITLVSADNTYTTLKTQYALADETVGQSDGVDYAISVSTDGGGTYTRLLERNVFQNIWGAATLDLTAYLNQDLTIRLASSSRGNENYDWLQVTLDLIGTRSVIRDRGAFD